MQTAVRSRQEKARPNDRRQRVWRSLARDVRRNRGIYLMLVPVVIYYLIFCYGPMYGLQIAFKDFSPALGVQTSPWVGLQHFKEFFSNFYFWRLMRNTLVINILDLVLGFPAPIVLALLLNEVRSGVFKRTAQTITYMPHFISLVVVAGIMLDFLARGGLINGLLQSVGVGPIDFFQQPAWFPFLFVGSGIWQGIGWGSIIYLAALSGIDPALYEAAMVDGAGRFRQLLNITLPGLAPTIIILLILRIGGMMAVGYEKIILLYNPSVYETADVISSYVYRRGLLQMDYSYSAAVGLFNAIINCGLLYVANFMSRRWGDNSLW